jgi:hypothetical protein
MGRSFLSERHVGVRLVCVDELVRLFDMQMQHSALESPANSCHLLTA